MKTRNLWIGFIAVMVISFAVLLYYGREIYREAPPVPDKVLDPAGNVIFTAQDIKDGQNVWQTLGGQELGSVWGHGAYQAPDWSADWLHREAELMLDGHVSRLVYYRLACLKLWLAFSMDSGMHAQQNSCSNLT